MKFQRTYCSQCGAEFGPGDHGYSHCEDHAPSEAAPLPHEIAAATALLDASDSDLREPARAETAMAWARIIARARAEAGRKA
jgi:hypothetical protein